MSNQNNNSSSNESGNESKNKSPSEMTIEQRSAEAFFKNEEDKEDKWIQTLQEEAKEVYKTRGALCDSEGFYQHLGECWSDALQQVLFNADAIKEYIQYDLIHTFYSLKYDIPDEYFLPTEIESKNEYDKVMWINENDEKISNQKKWFLLYLREIQKRFLRHYVTESKRRTFKETCSPTGQELGDVAREQFIAISKSQDARVKGIQGQQSAIFGKVTPIEKQKYSSIYTNTLRPTLETYKKYPQKLAGGNISDLLLLLNVLNKLIFLKQLHYKNYTSLSLHLPKVSSNLDPTAFELAKGILVGISRHEIAFYECGKIQYYYDNNFGIFPFPWKNFFKHFMSLAKDIQNQNLRMEFCSFTYTNEEKNIFYKTNTYPIIQYMNINYGENNQHKISYFTLFFFKNEEVLNINTENKEDTIQFKKQLNKNEAVFLQVDSKKVYELVDFIILNKELFDNENEEYSNVGTEINIRARISPTIDKMKKKLLATILNKNEKLALELIEVLPVEETLTIKTKDGDLIPIVIFALERGLPNVAIQLIEKGYDINTSVDSETPLMIAIYKESIQVAAHLVAKKIDITPRDQYGKQAIHFAAFQESPVYVKLLVEYTNSDINSVTTLGRTPLFFASREGNIEVVKYLCDKGADPRIKDLGDKASNIPPQTAMDVAATDEIKEVLQNCIQEINKKNQQGGKRFKLFKTRRMVNKKNKKTRRH